MSVSHRRLANQPYEPEAIMSEHDRKLKERIRNAPHQSKPNEASLVMYDRDGRWLFEVYGRGKASLRISTSQPREN
jgi:hypothetical protein